MSTDAVVSNHLHYMLGASEANVAHAGAANTEIAISRRMDSAVAAIADAVSDADVIWRALHTLGMPAAKDLAQALDAIQQAAREIRQCQSDLVVCQLRASEQSTANMMNAVLATVTTLSREPSP